MGMSEKENTTTASQRLGRQFTNQMMPLLINRVLALRQHANPSSDDIDTLVALPSAFSQAHQIQLLELIMPTLTMLLDPMPYDDTTPLSPLHTLVVPCLLSLASNMPTVFRESIQRLPQSTRSHLEAAVRYNVQSQQRAQQLQQEQRQQELEKTQQDRQPTIQLKMDFSNFA
ncbi:hypothetical protein DM01DRAFT_24818 [Hesseltinella vesiculosa]|uniref:LAA1-like C-terminal TPR repeats domain-containing protein n=1 Tax=Hesseltinella vesiculosa TaxID=101127 RepID=A0A1X2GEZ8_9FUNG|nr:hypothetical protein DM01DRAFT_24818 [Hesseltinella vesiculosa]